MGQTQVSDGPQSQELRPTPSLGHGICTSQENCARPAKNQEQGQCPQGLPPLGRLINGRTPGQSWGCMISGEEKTSPRATWQICQLPHTHCPAARPGPQSAQLLPPATSRPEPHGPPVPTEATKGPHGPTASVGRSTQNPRISPPPSPIETTWTFKEKSHYIFEKLKASVQPDQKGMTGSAENLVRGSGWVLQARP